MANCRECMHLSYEPVCAHNGSTWWLRPGEEHIDYACPCALIEPRETPLLVDALADAVSALMVGLTKSAHEQGEAALARYQEEMGDA